MYAIRMQFLQLQCCKDFFSITINSHWYFFFCFFFCVYYIFIFFVEIDLLRIIRSSPNQSCKSDTIIANYIHFNVAKCGKSISTKKDNSIIYGTCTTHSLYQTLSVNHFYLTTVVVHWLHAFEAQWLLNTVIIKCLVFNYSSIDW